VAGVIAAAASNGVGVVGLAPDSELLAFKACWPDPAGSRQATCDTYTLARAVDAALSAEVRILNLSLAGPEDPLLARLLGRAEEIGTLVVAAFDDSGTASFPASLPSVLAVGAAEPEGRPVAPPAGAGRRPRLRAPAAEILTTGPSGSYDFFSGSSLAAAQASAVAALVLERRPDLTPGALRDLLAPAVATGDGARLSACAALGRAVAADACAGPPPP
jgi:subtilisin family serine protease